MEESIKSAVFFDSENVSTDNVQKIIAYLSKQGDILFLRAYADWSIPSIKPWKELLDKIPFTAVQQFHHNEKQSVDKLLIMDAIETAVKREDIKSFAIVSSDNGYHSLALRLRELGKQVTGFGEKGKCSSLWIKSCNKFVYPEDFNDNANNNKELLSVEKNKAEESAKVSDVSIEKLLEKAFDKTPAYKKTGKKLISRVIETIKRQYPDFNKKDYGAKSAKELFLKFPEIFTLSDDGKPKPTYFVEKINS